MCVNLFIILFLITPVLGDVDFISKTRNFSVELLYQAQQNTDADVMLSPYVIWSLLVSLTDETLGVTRKQLSNLFLATENRNEFVEQLKNLRTSLLVKDDVNIILLNFLFYGVDLHVYPESIRKLETDFSFVTKRVDFNSSGIINRVSRTMRQCGPMGQYYPITFPPLTDFDNFTMVMCNCFIFKANWLKPFSIIVDRLQVKAHFRSSNFESLHASVTELPYEGDKYCMLIIRPLNGYDIKHVYKNLRNVSLKDILEKLENDTVEFGLREVEVELPNYKIRSRVILNEPLVNMGLSEVFYENFANFDNFAEDKIYIGEIAQRVSVIFGDLKTTVQAYTPSFDRYRGILLRTEVEKKPFIFFIMEKSMSTVLFGGSYTKNEIYE